MSIAVYLLSRPSFEKAELLRFLADTELNWKQSQGAKPAENLVEVAGRVCYMSFGDKQSPKSNVEYIENLVKQGHESVLEHANWTFLVTGVSRAFSHQLVRHRAGVAFSQLSQQYHEETEATFVEPAHIRDVPDARRIWQHAMQTARESYGQILKLLKKKNIGRMPGMSEKEVRRAILSAARTVLPNATATTIVFTANARALRHFLEVRGAIIGDEEMRWTCRALLEQVKTEAAALFADFAVDTLPDGSPVVRKRLLDELVQ